MGKSKISLSKHTFFAHTALPEPPIGLFSHEDFDLEQLGMEYSTSYKLFMANKHYWSKKKKFLRYLNFLHHSMMNYYQLDYVKSEIERLNLQLEEIAQLFGEECSKSNKSIKKLTDFVYDTISVFTSIAKLRKQLGNLNTKRSQFSYSRAVGTLLISFLQQSCIAELIHELNKMLNNPYSFAEGLDVLNQSREAITDLGCILYALRFLINLSLILKHINQAAINKDLRVTNVLKQELAKRGFVMANDLLWATVNVLTTYYNFFRISAAAVSPIIVSSLTFDVLLFGAQWIFSAYNYQKQVQELQNQQKNATGLEQAIIKRQMDMLQDEWEATCSYYAINILGAIILAVSFMVSMFFMTALALVLIAVINMLGNALYNTAEEYKKYQITQISIRREWANGTILNDQQHQELITALYKESEHHFCQFWQNLLCNIGKIAFIITAAAASWPVALGLLLMYGTYCLYHSYNQQENKKGEVVHDIYRILEPELGSVDEALDALDGCYQSNMSAPPKLI